LFWAIFICLIFSYKESWIFCRFTYALGDFGRPDGPEQYMATNFSDAGSIDGITRGICDGDYKYTVSSSGIIQYGKIY
jgi:hypothetical protein